MDHEIKTIRYLTTYERDVIRHALQQMIESTPKDDSYSWGANIMLETGMLNELMWASPKS